MAQLEAGQDHKTNSKFIIHTPLTDQPKEMFRSNNKYMQISSTSKNIFIR